jgi:hypothetical protein
VSRDAETLAAIVAALARAVRTRRALEKTQWRGVLCIEAGDAAGSLVVADDVHALHGRVTPPGLPSVTVRLAPEALLDLVRGRRPAEEVWRGVVVEGDASLFARFVAALGEQHSWLSVRSG